MIVLRLILGHVLFGVVVIVVVVDVREYDGSRVFEHVGIRGFVLDDKSITTVLFVGTVMGRAEMVEGWQCMTRLEVGFPVQVFSFNKKSAACLRMSL